jgi:trehalose 6-phosphate synthase
VAFRLRRVVRGAPGTGWRRGRRSHANPIAVDTAEFDALATSDAVRARRDELRSDRPEILVVRVDRTDPAKNAVRGFQAVGRLLEREPALHGRVVLLALLDPSRQEIPEYVDYRRATEEAARAVSDRFGREGWQPVRLEVRDDFPASVAAYTVTRFSSTRSWTGSTRHEGGAARRACDVSSSRAAGAFAGSETGRSESTRWTSTTRRCARVAIAMPLPSGAGA